MSRKRNVTVAAVQMKCSTHVEENIAKVRIIFCQAITIIVNDITSIFQRFLIIFIIQISKSRSVATKIFADG